MIRLSVLYPKTDGAKFDHDYYRDQHVPLAVSTWGIERYEIERTIFRGDHRANPPWSLDELDQLVPKALLSSA
jgi:uncharacterized protein (TIGR02118 family)